jgi:hypothetical protein
MPDVSYQHAEHYPLDATGLSDIMAVAASGLYASESALDLRRRPSPSRLGRLCRKNPITPQRPTRRAGQAAGQRSAALVGATDGLEGGGLGQMRQREIAARQSSVESLSCRASAEPPDPESGLGSSHVERATTADLAAEKLITSSNLVGCKWASSVSAHRGKSCSLPVVQGLVEADEGWTNRDHCLAHCGQPVAHRFHAPHRRECIFCRT